MPAFLFVDIRIILPNDISAFRFVNKLIVDILHEQERWDYLIPAMIIAADVLCTSFGNKPSHDTIKLSYAILCGKEEVFLMQLRC